MLRNSLAAMCLSVLGILPASASDWRVGVTLYGWLPGVTGTIGTPLGDIDLDGGGGADLSVLDSFFMGALELQNGRWGLIADYLFADFSESIPNPGGGYLNVSVGTDVSQTAGYVFYRFAGTETVSADVLAGARGYKIKVSTAYTGGAAPDVTYNATLKRTDFVLGARVKYRFDEHWYVTGWLDLGRDSSDLTSYQALGLLGYQFNENWSVSGGYRYLNLSDASGGFSADIDLGGPFIAVTLHF